MELKLNILDLITDATCYDFLRQIRWSSGVICPHCQSAEVIKNGNATYREELQTYKCKGCKKKFNDITDAIFQDSNKSLKVWILTLYFMGLNLSNVQIAKELDMTEKTAQEMTTRLREGIVKKSLLYKLATQLRLTKFT